MDGARRRPCPWSAHAGRAVAAAALVVLAAGAALGQEGGAPTTAAASPAAPTAWFDPGQEAPRAPVTPALGRDPDGAIPEGARFLLGDPFGARAAWAERGFRLYATTSQFEQDVAAGGLDRAARWGSKYEVLAHLDGRGLGRPGTALDLVAEGRLGATVEPFAGTLAPPNLAQHLPLPDQDLMSITGFQLTHALTDHAGFFLGKINTIAGDPDTFLTYPLTSRFWNAAFTFNLALDRFPYTAPGAGAYWLPEGGPALTFLAIDTHDAPRTTGLENLGRNGAFLYAEASQPTRFLGQPGRHVLGGLFGTGSFDSLDPAPFLDLPGRPTGVAPAQERGTWSLIWNVEQRLITSPADPARGLGLYVQNGLGDGNPNPVRWFLSAALMGNSPLPRRPGDTLGAGYYHLGMSGAAIASSPGLRSESGVELYYNARLATGCHLTGDLQVIEPGLGPLDAALLLGLRLKVDF